MMFSAALDGFRGRIQRRGDRLDGLGIDRFLPGLSSTALINS
ncbi:hypothetical protein [Rhizobium sp. 9140]|nr:hypothetical protein [Rhizobium sp. 9140]